MPRRATQMRKMRIYILQNIAFSSRREKRHYASVENVFFPIDSQCQSEQADGNAAPQADF